LDSIGIGPSTRNRAGEYVVEQEAGVWNAVADEAFDTAGDLRGDDFGMIKGRDQVAVTRKVRGEVGSGATVDATVVRIDDEWPRAVQVGVPDNAREETIAGRVERFEGVGCGRRRDQGPRLRSGVIHNGLHASLVDGRELSRADFEFYNELMPTPFESAQLNLQLFDLRREPVLREARAWFLADFNPESMADLMAAVTGARNASFRMVLGFWDMAASLVSSGAIDADSFLAAHTEITGTFCKIYPFVAEMRLAVGEPDFLKHMEAVVMAAPDAEATLKRRRERLLAMARARKTGHEGRAEGARAL
jgi:hypothetical protein